MATRTLSFEEVELTPEQKGSVEVLWETLGGTINEQGYRAIDKHIGLIYGDSITLERCEAILGGLKKKASPVITLCSALAALLTST